MGWNDSRVTLVAPKWKMVSEEAPSEAQSIDGTTVRILHPERVEDSMTTQLRPNDVQAWLQRYGFEVLQQSEHGNRLKWKDVEASLGVQDGELAEITLTFTLSRDSPAHLEVWKALVQDLCEAWNFSLYSSYLGFPVEAGEFVRLLGLTPAWKDFETGFKWPAPFQEPDSPAP